MDKEKKDTEPIASKAEDENGDGPQFNSNVDLNVYTIKKDDDKPTWDREVPIPLPGSKGECFVMTLVGPRSSGKSVVINNLILRDEMLRGLFERILIISPTIHSDSSSRFLIAEAGKENVYEAYSEQIIQELIDSVKDKEKHERSMKLIILDDVIGSIPKYNSLVYNLTSKARHWSISMIISTQNLRELPPVCRNNTTNVEEPHKFMYVDSDFNVYKCFTEHVWSKYTEDGRYNEDFVGGGNSLENDKKISANSITENGDQQRK